METSDKQAAGTDSASGPGLACKMHKLHYETWSTILGTLFSKGSKGEGDSDISTTDAQDQAVHKEFQKYVAEFSLIDVTSKRWENTYFVLLHFQK